MTGGASWSIAVSCPRTSAARLRASGAADGDRQPALAGRDRQLHARARSGRAASGSPATCPRWRGAGDRAGAGRRAVPTRATASRRCRSTPRAFPTTICNMRSPGFRLAVVWLGMTVLAALAYQAPDGLRRGDACTTSRPGARPRFCAFDEAMMTGLARDGGLYVPEIVPVMARPTDRRTCRPDL